MSNEINLGYLLKILKSSWWKIVVFTVAISLVVALFTIFMIPKKYNSQIEFYILNTNTEAGYTTSTLLSASDYLANDYISIIQSDHMLEAISEKLLNDHGVEYSSEEIRGMISSETKTTTSIFSITVENGDPYHAYWIAGYIAEMASPVITEFSKPSEFTYTASNGEVFVVTVDHVDPVKVLRVPTLNESEVSPSVVSNTFLTAIITAVIAYIVYLLIDILDSTIRTEETVKEKVSRPLIGTIPEWKIHSTKKD